MLISNKRILILYNFLFFNNLLIHRKYRAIFYIFASIHIIFSMSIILTYGGAIS